MLKQFDILEENVTRMCLCKVPHLEPMFLNGLLFFFKVIESITSYREPQPEFEAMYLLMPTNQNVDRVIRDFSGKKQYAAAHLFFIEGEFLFQSAEAASRGLLQLANICTMALSLSKGLRNHCFND